jgi:hypothetical protein
MLTKEEFIIRQATLDKEILEIWETPYFDGITDYEKYIKAPVKVLWILKEPNGKQGGNHREFHKDVRDYPRWMATFGNIMRVSYGILNEIYDFNDIPKIDKSECAIEDQFILDEIAIININKSGGESKTPPGKMDEEYRREEVKEFLKKQIEFIDPQIIINTHRVYQFFADQIGQNKIEKINGEHFGRNNDCLIIDTSHPNRAHSESYCNNILRIVNNY